jgi:hypothetical protein
MTLKKQKIYIWVVIKLYFIQLDNIVDLKMFNDRFFHH